MTVSNNENRIKRPTDNDPESCLMLHSQINNLVQVYTFSEVPSGSSILLSSPDPSVLNLDIDGMGRITEIRMESMQYGDIGKTAYDPGPGRSYREKDIKFFRLCMTRSDLTVHELVVYMQNPDRDEATDSDPSVEDFTRSIIRHPRRDTSKAEVITGEGEFVLPDGLTTIETPKSKTESQMPKWGQIQTALHGARDNGLLVAALSRSEHRKEGESNSVNVEVVTNQVKEMLEDDIDSSNLPLGTL
jgi:RNA polymerase I-specific transcription initiation factor RRN6